MESSSCTQYQYRCLDGKCIDIIYFCNGENNCNDGSDELTCPKRANNNDQHTSASYDSRYPQFPNDYSNNNKNNWDSRRNEWPVAQNVPPAIKVATYDTPQTVVVGNDVVFRCRDESTLRTDVYWSRPNGMPLPSNANDVNGRLTIVNLQDKDSGTYVCHAKGAPSEQATVYLNVVHGSKSQCTFILSLQLFLLLSLFFHIYYSSIYFSLRLWAATRKKSSYMSESEQFVTLLEGEQDPIFLIVHFHLHFQAPHPILGADQ